MKLTVAALALAATNAVAVPSGQVDSVPGITPMGNVGIFNGPLSFFIQGISNFMAHQKGSSVN
jgi:hypothetical protein